MERVATERFSLPLPDQWDDRTAVTLTGPSALGGFQPNIVVTRDVLCDHLGLGAFADGWVGRLGDQVPIDATGTVEHLRIDGRRAQLRTVAWRATGVAITQLVGLVTDGADAYAIVCTASTDGFAEAEPVFRAAITGFRFAGPPASDDEA